MPSALGPFMVLQSDNLFTSVPVRHLLETELRALAPELAGLFGPQGLFLRAHADAPATISAPMLGRVAHLFVATPGRLDGEAACEPGELPFADESFRVVLVQHAGEAVTDTEGLRDELARVLAPGGVAIVLGFHPVSLWRPWLHSRRGTGEGSLQLSSAGEWRAALARGGVDTYSIRRVGAVLPLRRSSPPSRVARTLGASWLLLARKRTNAMTPLRVHAGKREIAGGPQLASSIRRAVG